MNLLIHFFDWLVASTCRASVLTIAVLILQSALRRSLSARWRYALWLPVLLVLLMPVRPQSRWSIENLIAATPAVEISGSYPADLPAPIRSKPAVGAAPRRDWRQMIALSWAVAAGAALAVGAISFGVTMRRIRRASIESSPEQRARVVRIADEIKLRRRPRICVSRRVSSPAVTGLWRPLLLLPAHLESAFTDDEKHCILKHELMHLKRGDHWLNAVLCLLIVLHWFNPLLWIAFLKARGDRELACDADVLGDGGPIARREYGAALLKVEGAFLSPRFSLGFVGVFQRGAALRQRILFIAHGGRTGPLVRAVAATALVAFTFFGVTRAQPPAAAGSGGQESARGVDAARLRDKLESIIIPQLELRQATIGEAIELLKSKSVEADTGEKDPALRGVSIALKLDPAGNAAGALAGPAPDEKAVRITLSLRNIPVIEALKYITGLANLKYKITPLGITVRPNAAPPMGRNSTGAAAPQAAPNAASIDEPLVTREWRLPADFHALDADPKARLLALGISFPPGASVMFIRAANRLIVRNTQHSLDLIEAIVNAPPKAPTATKSAPARGS